MERKLLLILLKYIPIVMMILVIINNIIIITDESFIFNDLLGYLMGNSLVFSVILILCSYVFLYCIWQRVVIYTNLTLIMFSLFWSILDLSDDFLYYYIGCYVIISIGVLAALFLHLKRRSLGNNNSRVVRNEKRSLRNERLLYFIIKCVPLTYILLLMFDNLLNYFDCTNEILDYSCGYIFGNSITFSLLLIVLNRVLNIGLWNLVLIITNAAVLVLGLMYTIYVNVVGYDDLPDEAIYSAVYLTQISGLILSIILAIKSYSKRSYISMKMSD